MSQWIWNVRLELGQKLVPTSMRLTDFTPALAVSPAPPAQLAHLEEPSPTTQSTQAEKNVSYGPPQWARPSYTKGFAGADFALQPDGTLQCPAGHPLYAQERRPERNGSVRVLYGARIGHCRACPLRERCQESGTTLKPRRGSRVLWPIFSSSPGSGEAPPVRQEALAPPPGSLILWGDWERCQIRRSFLTLLRTQAVTVTQRAPEDRNVEETEGRTPAVLTRAQRARFSAQLGTATGTQCPWCFCSCFDDHCARTALCFCSVFRLPSLCFLGAWKLLLASNTRTLPNFLSNGARLPGHNVKR